MTSELILRAAQAADIPQMAQVVDTTLFPGDMLAPMIAPFLEGDADAVWRVALMGGQVVGIAYAQVEPMTDRTWNLKAIAVAETAQRKGAGRGLLQDVERVLATTARLVVIDTTQLEDQAAGRALYAACGYAQTAIVPEFWEPGVDKVTFVKPL